MRERNHKMGAVLQNVLLGSVTGVMVGINLKIVFQHIGGVDLIWILFFLIGPVVGYFSGKERQRIEKLNLEKMQLEKDLDKVQASFKLSAKKYRLLVEHANDAIFLTTAEGKILVFNEATSLLSGYTKDELRTMNVSQLQDGENEKKKSHKAWLDNGVYRYEEIWKNKNGDRVALEINSKWIQFGGYRLILHIGRNIVKQKEANWEEEVRYIRNLHEKKLMETASANRSFQNRVLDPIARTVQLLYDLEKKYPAEREKLTRLYLEWENIHGVLKELTYKNDRDLLPFPNRYDLNKILIQEMDYLDFIMEPSNFIAKTSFAPDLPQIFGQGRDFSLAFGFVLKAVLESMAASKTRELFVSTHLIDEHVLVEIETAAATSFKEHLFKIINPLFDGKSSLKENDKVSLAVCQLLFESFGANMDVGQNEKGGIRIRIRVPVVIKKDKTKGKIQKEGPKSVIIA